MTTQEKKNKIMSMVTDMLDEANDNMMQKVDRALNCGVLDIDAWDENDNPIIYGWIITAALLQNESMGRELSGTRFEAEVKKYVKKLRKVL